MFLNGIILVALGLLAAASLITKKAKDAEKVINVLVPFQGYIGIAGFVFGLWSLFTAIRRFGWVADGYWSIFSWITYLAVAILLIVLGFLMGFALISKYALSKNEEAKKKAEELLAKLSGYQATLGIIGLCVGLWAIIFGLF